MSLRMTRTSALLSLRAALLGGALLASADAAAFCGFFVSGADAELTNNASQVVLMRNAMSIYNTP